jgi:hypothetical protein
MQPLTDDPRASLTAAAVAALIVDTPALQVTAGLELLNPDLTVVEDIGVDLMGGSVTRNSYANLHASCTVQLARQLDWATAIVRPTMTISDGTTSATFRLGAYYTSTPRRVVEAFPVIFDVTGYDILLGLATPVGESYALTAGAFYLTEIENILISRGYTAYVIDQTSAATVLPTTRVWPLDDQTTWLSVVNDLLASIGYAGIWSDWHGRLRVGPYQVPTDRTPEWVYTTDLETSILGPARTVERDFFDAPNRWVFHRTNNIDDVAPVEGAGVYTFINQSMGPTSIDGRGGRTISRVVGVDAADQTSLVAQAQVSIDADLRLKTTLAYESNPVPLHWHFDKVTVNDPDVGPPMDVLATEWTLPLDGSNMRHSWTVLE